MIEKKPATMSSRIIPRAPFVLLSILGMLSYSKFNKTLILYLFSISFILELFHLVIPNRSFQFQDLFGNVVGVLVSILIVFIFNYWKKNE